MVSPIFVSLRPKQWTKNLLIFITLLFAGKELFFSCKAWLYSLAGFFLFCGLSGSVYILNDIIDISEDRIHPIKQKRPIASGLISLNEAKAASLLILIIVLFAAINISEHFFYISLAFFMLNLAYSFKLKNIAILDMICIAICSLLRLYAGVGTLKAISSNIEVNNFFALSIFFFAMFQNAIKRRQDLIISENYNIKTNEASNYSIDFIEQAITVFASLSIMFYALFTNSYDISNNNKYLTYTLIFFLIIFLRYLYLIRNDDEKNEKLLSFDNISKDKYIVLSNILLIISIGIILYFF